MSTFKKGDDFNERLSTAAKARQAALEKFRARPRVDDAAVIEQQAARLATSQARDARKAARVVESARLEAEANRQAAEEVARKAAAEAEEAVRKSAAEACGRPRKSPWKPSARPPAMPVTPRASRGGGNRGAPHDLAPATCSGRPTIRAALLHIEQ
jgi:Family of unknown function (DUF6481)